MLVGNNKGERTYTGAIWGKFPPARSFKTNADRFVRSKETTIPIKWEAGWNHEPESVLSLHDHLIFRSAMLWRHCIYCVGTLSDCKEQFGLQLRKLEIPVVNSPTFWNYVKWNLTTFLNDDLQCGVYVCDLLGKSVSNQTI